MISMQILEEGKGKGMGGEIAGNLCTPLVQFP